MITKAERGAATEENYPVNELRLREPDIPRQPIDIRVIVRFSADLRFLKGTVIGGPSHRCR